MYTPFKRRRPIRDAIKRVPNLINRGEINGLVSAFDNTRRTKEGTRVRDSIKLHVNKNNKKIVNVFALNVFYSVTIKEHKRAHLSFFDNRKNKKRT